MSGITLQTIGTFLVGFVALKVHHRVIVRQIVDQQVLRTMRREQRLGVLAAYCDRLYFAAHMKHSDQKVER